LAENGSYLATYGVDSTRGEIQLSGSADLVMGEAKVYFDYSFTAIISDKVPLKVLVTPTTNTIRGQLYVERKSVYGFVVKELNGMSDGKFDWLVIARRKGYEGNDATASASADFSTSSQAPETTGGGASSTPAPTPLETTAGDSLPLTGQAPSPTPEATITPTPSESPSVTPEITPEATPAPSETPTPETSPTTEVTPTQ